MNNMVINKTYNEDFIMSEKRIKDFSSTQSYELF